LLREPLLHFLLGGAALFAAHAWLNPGAAATGDARPRPVHITKADVDWLRGAWARRWRRPPTDQELRGLLADHLEEQLLSREARELGLDVDDIVVRRRLAQKMTFLLEDTAAVAEPSEEEIRRVYEAKPGRFQRREVISFAHVYFNPGQRGGQAETDAARALERISRLPSPAPALELGDRFLLPAEFENEDRQAVANLFGAQFADRVFALAPGRWSGPVKSGYGLHLVRVSHAQRAHARALADARAEILDELRRERQKAMKERYVAALLTKYEVRTDDAVKPLLAPWIEPHAKASGR
jgi:hypothetical protein